ncbi:MAG: hypothetical protein H7Y88_12535 [Phycisphaerales bacterium]|nr:hypothetical protein [Phycisphaerales bacterium]
MFGLFAAVLMYFEGVKHLGLQDVFGSAALAALIGVAAWYGMFRLSYRPPTWGTIGSDLAHCQLCIVCGYDLASIRDGDDGCIVCPECGGAWRLAEVQGRPVDPRPGET